MSTGRESAQTGFLGSWNHDSDGLVSQGSLARTTASLLLGVALPIAATGCRMGPAQSGPGPESRAICEQRSASFQAFLGALPADSIASPIAVALPTSTLGQSPGRGPVLELTATSVTLEGETLGTDPQALSALKGLLEQRLSEQRLLYVAAAADLEVGVLRRYAAEAPPSVEIRLLVRTLETSRRGAETASNEAVTLAQDLLAERSPERREELAVRGYSEFARCGALRDAVTRSSTAAPSERWRTRRAALIAALPSCDCSELDTVNLQQIASAEQRAGALGLGYLPLSFVRDERCGATMPKRSIGKLVKQMEEFDAEFAGKFQDDTLRFEQVLDDDRLLNYFCNALPGETLAAQQRSKKTLYLRVRGSTTCQAWRFEPLASGAPMGTWRRVAPSDPPLALHYWQAAEEIRLFGPIAAADSKPTDDTAWECSQEFRLTAVDARGVQSETGHWFFDEASCRAAPPEAELSGGCVNAVLGGAP